MLPFYYYNLLKMSLSISESFPLSFSISSVQPFNSSSSLDFTSLILWRTDSISVTLDFISSKLFCAAWNLSILTNIGSPCFWNDVGCETLAGTGGIGEIGSSFGT